MVRAARALFWESFAAELLALWRNRAPIEVETLSKHETPMTVAYWRRVGGILLEEFCAVPRSQECGGRWMDGVIVHGRETRRAAPGELIDLAGASITVIQAKARRLNMPLMGQTFFSAKLMERYAPSSIHSVALCLQDDPELRPLLEAYPGFEVVVVSAAELLVAAP